MLDMKLWLQRGCFQGWHVTLAFSCQASKVLPTVRLPGTAVLRAKRINAQPRKDRVVQTHGAGPHTVRSNLGRRARTGSYRTHAGRRRAKSQFGDHDDNSGWNASYAAFAPTFTLRPIPTLVRYQRRPTHQGGDRCGPLGFNNTMAAVIRDIGYSLYDREERADHVRLRCSQEERPSLAPAHGGRRITDVGFALSSIDPSPPPEGSRIRCQL